MSAGRAARLIAAGVLCALTLAAASACSRPRPATRAVTDARVEPVLLSNPDERYDGSLRIAAIFPTVGRYALSGIQCVNGARLAVEDLNRKGGIRGRRLRLLEYRTGSFFVDARHAAERATGQGGVLAIIGSNSSAHSMSIAEIAERRGVVQVSNISTAEDLTWDPGTGRERPHVFRVCGSDTFMGAMLAQFAVEQLQARRVAVLFEVGSAYSARLAQGFLKAFQSPEHGRVAEEFFYLPLETDFRPQLRAIRTFRADVLFLPGFFTDATLVARQAATLGLDDTLLGGDGWSNRLLFKRARPVGRAYYADLCSPPAAFGERYRRTFGDAADGCRAVLAYDAVLAVATALERLGPLGEAALTDGLTATRERLRQQLTEVDFRGNTGRIHFDRHRNRQGGMAIMEVVPGPAGTLEPHLFYREDAG